MVGVGGLAFECYNKLNTARASKASARRQLEIVLFIPLGGNTLKQANRSKYTLRGPSERNRAVPCAGGAGWPEWGGKMSRMRARAASSFFRVGCYASVLEPFA